MQIRPLIPIATAIVSAIAGLIIGYAVGNTQEVAASPPEPHVYKLSSTTSPAAVAPATEADNTAPKYVLGASDGFVAVFYYNRPDIKELTRTPTSSLTTDEFNRLSEGVYIYNEEQLVRILQDYDS